MKSCFFYKKKLMPMIFLLLHKFDVIINAYKKYRIFCYVNYVGINMSKKSGVFHHLSYGGKHLKYLSMIPSHKLK